MLVKIGYNLMMGVNYILRGEYKMEEIQDTYVWEDYERWLGLDDDFEDRLGHLLNEYKINIKDLVVIFYSKLARWGQEEFQEMVHKVFEEFIKSKSKDVKDMYKQMEKSNKDEIKSIIKQLNEIKEKW
jgi:hypothetical protein